MPWGPNENDGPSDLLPPRGVPLRPFGQMVATQAANWPMIPATGGLAARKRTLGHS
jgi:hypothetical protein